MRLIVPEASSSRSRIDTGGCPPSVPIQIPVVLDSQGYFASAKRQLIAQVDHRVTIPKRTHFSQPLGAPKETNDDEMLMENDAPTQSGPRSVGFLACRPSHAAIPRSPIQDLKRSTRTTSQEFGTTAGRARRTPSLPFNPPFKTMW